MKVKIGEHSIHCLLEGPPDRPALMLSHSLATNLHMWEPQRSELGRLCRLLRVDTLGHGESDAPAGAYSLDALAEDFLKLLDALGLERVHFVGLSMGGMIGQVLALMAPERLRSLVLCDTASRIPPEAASMWEERIRIAADQGMEPLVGPTIARWFTPGFLEGQEEVVARIGEMIRGTAPAGYIGCCHAIARLNLTDRLPAIELPTLIMVGADDPGTPVAASELIHRQIAGSVLEIIPSASHLSNIEQASEFNRRLTEFLEQVQ